MSTDRGRWFKTCTWWAKLSRTRQVTLSSLTHRLPWAVKTWQGEVKNTLVKPIKATSLSSQLIKSKMGKTRCAIYSQSLIKIRKWLEQPLNTTTSSLRKNSLALKALIRSLSHCSDTDWNLTQKNLKALIAMKTGGPSWQNFLVATSLALAWLS